MQFFVMLRTEGCGSLLSTGTFSRHLSCRREVASLTGNFLRDSLKQKGQISEASTGQKEVFAIAAPGTASLKTEIHCIT